MAVTNNAMIIRRELLARVAKLLLDDRLVEDIDRIPVQIRPKNGDVSRCCVYKDRAMLKYKLMALLGFSVQQEDEEITPLSVYAYRALVREDISDPPLTVVDDACSGCIKANYTVTNICRGCVARPCIINCPKGAIDFHSGHAEIDPKKCVNCGICQKNCPYHAIVYIPVPCEESCQVGAISKDEEGIEHIDYSKCKDCGLCAMKCPKNVIYNPRIEAMKAKKAQERINNGEDLPLLGVPLAIKDNLCYKDHLMTASSKMLEGYKAPYTAPTVHGIVWSDWAIKSGHTHARRRLQDTSVHNGRAIH